MHWNNGRFHENITVGKTIYITDHKHVAVFGDSNYVGYGSAKVDSYVYGKNVVIDAAVKGCIKSQDGNSIQSKKFILIQAGSNLTDYKLYNGLGIELNSNEHSTTIKSTDNTVNIIAGTHINLSSNHGVTLNNISYGTTLPTDNNVEGKIFFKLIS